jgi:hypothetical protein
MNRLSARIIKLEAGRPQSWRRWMGTPAGQIPDHALCSAPGC